MNINPNLELGLIRALDDEKMKATKKETGGFYRMQNAAGFIKVNRAGPDVAAWLNWLSG